MKTTLFTAAILMLSLISCKKEIRLEVKRITETDKTTVWDMTVSHPAFSSTVAEVEKSCVKINDELAGLVNGIKAAFQEQAAEQNASLDSAGLKQIGPYELFIQDSVFLADQNYISVLMSAYEMLGGANGITNFYGINYDVRTQRFLDKEDILNYDKANDINALLAKYLKDPDKCNTFEAPTIENCTALNFTLHTVEFTYAKYILGPGACGPVIISGPREKMQGMLK